MVFVYKDFTAGSRLTHISKCTISKLNAYKENGESHKQYLKRTTLI